MVLPRPVTGCPVTAPTASDSETHTACGRSTDAPAPTTARVGCGCDSWASPRATTSAGASRCMLRSLVDEGLAATSRCHWSGCGHGLPTTPPIRIRLRVLARRGAATLVRRSPIDASVRSIARLRDETTAQRHAGQRALPRTVTRDDARRLRTRSGCWTVAT